MDIEFENLLSATEEINSLNTLLKKTTGGDPRNNTDLWNAISLKISVDLSDHASINELKSSLSNIVINLDSIDCEESFEWLWSNGYRNGLKKEPEYQKETSDLLRIYSNELRAYVSEQLGEPLTLDEHDMFWYIAK